MPETVEQFLAKANLAIGVGNAEDQSELVDALREEVRGLREYVSELKGIIQRNNYYIK